VKKFANWGMDATECLPEQQVAKIRLIERGSDFHEEKGKAGDSACKAGAGLERVAGNLKE